MELMETGTGECGQLFLGKDMLLAMVFWSYCRPDGIGMNTLQTVSRDDSATWSCISRSL
jgi:hypothetical protein